MKTKCGDSSYNTAAEFCDDGNVYAKCVGETYNPASQTCENDVLKTKCGDSSYYPAAEFCNGGNVYAKCGANNYNPATEFCSDADIYAKCGGETYDPANQTCENNTLKTKCGDSSYNPAAEFCDGGNVYSKCGADNYNPVAEFCDGGNVYAKCGANNYNTALEFCDDDNVYAKCDGETYNSANLICENNILKTKFTDSRDGKGYTAITIGSQTWMAENLNYDISGSVCYEGRDANCEKYGRLYNWSTATGGASGSSLSPSGVQGACPVGWHLPSDDEWTELMDYIGGVSTAGKKLKAMSGWNNGGFAGVDGNGTDEYGWSALPGGLGASGNYFDAVGNHGHWWSATEGVAYYARRWSMSYDYESVSWGNGERATLFSVRCVQDE
jgi:uncharacterized protein (TIGR02145 family)